MTSREVRAVLAAACIALAGCNPYWHREPVGLLEYVRRGQVVEVWRGSSSVKLHGISVTTDSIIGVSFIRPVGCDSCRIAIPRAEVDSVRFGSPEGQFGMGVVYYILSGILLFIIACGRKGCSFGS